MQSSLNDRLDESWAGGPFIYGWPHLAAIAAAVAAAVAAAAGAAAAAVSGGFASMIRFHDGI